MKKRFLFTLVALFAATFCLVSCNKDPEEKNNNESTEENWPTTPGDQGNPSDPDYIDLKTVDFLKYAWWITELSNDEIPASTMQTLQQAIQNKTLQFDNFGVSGQPNYKGYGMNLSIHVQSQYCFFVDSYKMENGKHWLNFTSNGVLYKGELRYTQDSAKIYAQYKGTATDSKGEHKTTFTCWISKR